MTLPDLDRHAPQSALEIQTSPPGHVRDRRSQAAVARQKGDRPLTTRHPRTSVDSDEYNAYGVVPQPPTTLWCHLDISALYRRQASRGGRPLSCNAPSNHSTSGCVHPDNSCGYVVSRFFVHWLEQLSQHETTCALLVTRSSRLHFILFQVIKEHAKNCIAYTMRAHYNGHISDS